MKHLIFATIVVGCFSSIIRAEEANRPVPIIFDTDMGNDVDDVLALGMIHALQNRNACELLAVTLTKDSYLAAEFTDAINTFYGRGEIPIGLCHSGITPEPKKFIGLAHENDGEARRYPYELARAEELPDAVMLLRKTLASAEDQSVVIVQVGFSTNLANLLQSKGDDVSPLTGVELVKRKVKLLSLMAGGFKKLRNSKRELVDHKEFNIINDIPAAQRVAKEWPTPMVWSGFEIGLGLGYPHESILGDFQYVKHHPLAEAYILYRAPPHNRPTWDLTSVLYAVHPEREYFELSNPGNVTVHDNGVTEFQESETGSQRILKLKAEEKKRILEAMRVLCSEPPKGS